MNSKRPVDTNVVSFVFNQDPIRRDYIVIESAPDIARNWAVIRVHSQRAGKTIERQDTWIAAVALTLNLPLITHNAAHFAHIPLLHLITEPDR